MRRFLVGVLLATFAALALSSSVQKSATWDETHYLGVGTYLAKTQRWDIPSVFLHPPLTFYLSGAPLLFLDLDPACFEKGPGWDVLAGVRRGQCLLRQSTPAGDRLLFWARLPTLLVGVALGLLVYSWSSKIWGGGGGLLSLFLYALSPNILAHARLLTPDVPLTLCGFGATYCFWQGVRTRSLRPAVLSGLFLGSALLVKYSAVVWIPIVGVLAVAASALDPLRPRPSRRRPLDRRPLILLALVLGLGFFVVLAGYGFRISHYFAGIRDQQHVLGTGVPAFLNGEVSDRGWWYYHLYAFAIKVPVVTLLLIAVALGRLRGKEWFTTLCLLLPVATFFTAFSVFHELNIGLRYVLPVFPFLMVLAGSALATSRPVRPMTRRWLVGATVLLCTFYAYENLSVHPHYLTYFNQLVGGPRNGHHHLVDSNLDWGQDLKILKRYMEKQGIDEIKLSYFGSADPSQYGIRYEALPSFVLPASSRPCMVIRPGDTVAVSATNLYSVFIDLGQLGRTLRGATPQAQVGNSILIYEAGRSFDPARSEFRENRETPAGAGPG